MRAASQLLASGTQIEQMKLAIAAAGRIHFSRLDSNAETLSVDLGLSQPPPLLCSQNNPPQAPLPVPPPAPKIIPDGME